MEPISLPRDNTAMGHISQDLSCSVVLVPGHNYRSVIGAPCRVYAHRTPRLSLHVEWNGAGRKRLLYNLVDLVYIDQIEISPECC